MARESRHEFIDKEMRPLSSATDVDVEPQRQRAGKKFCTMMPFRTSLEKGLAVVAVILLLVCAVVIGLLAVEKGKLQATDEEDETGKIRKYKMSLKCTIDVRTIIRSKSVSFAPVHMCFVLRAFSVFIISTDLIRFNFRRSMWSMCLVHLF